MKTANRHRVFNSVYLVIFVAGIGFFALSFYLLGILPGQELQKEIDARAPADMADYTAQEERGRTVYGREGCGYCHTQQVRFVAEDVARWGAPTQAWETRFDYPQLWGTRRIGPDLARESGVRSNDWQLTHLFNPRFVVGDSVMPGYPWLFDGDAAKPTADAVSLVAYLQALGRPRIVSGYDDETAPAPSPMAAGHADSMDTSTLAARRQAISAQARLDAAVPQFSLPDNPEDYSVALAAGKTAFEQNCTACHGVTGAGDGPGAASLLPRPADLRAASFTSGRIADALWNGRYGSSMPAWRDLDNSTLAALTVYVHSLHTSQALPETATGESTVQTAALFEKNCSSCHGATGQGDGPAARSLAPRPANFQLKQGNPDYLEMVLRNGIPGTAMPPWEEVLTDQQCDSLVRYLRSLYQPSAQE